MNGWLAKVLVASFSNPRLAARMVLGQNFSNAEIFGLAILVAIVLTFANSFVGYFVANANDPLEEFIRKQPILTAILQLVGIPLGAAISLGLSRLFGGRGSFRDTMVVFIWLNSAMVLVHVVFVFALPIMVPMAAPLGLAVLVWAIVAYACGLVEIHGFKNVYLVIAALIGLGIVFFLAIIVLATYLGLGPAGAP